ncbi:MAG: PIN domain-containing protein [Actinobacteria bacterium]|jgi:putative PIN family toxin of toxin-antitoxin system|nr:MAG: PIN domain-containing protein [Actinomycetota bacterium]
MAVKAKTRAFVDSNVIFSGLYSDKGPPGTVLEQAVEGRYTMVVSRQVLDEVVRTVAEKLPGALPLLQTLLLNLPLEVCGDPDTRDVVAWSKIVGEDDAPLAAAAAAAQVDLFVSGDNHFLTAAAAAEKRGLRIVSPTGFLASGY